VVQNIVSGRPLHGFVAQDAVDVVVNAAELTDVQRAQIEDIVKRKTDIAAENIVISTIAQ
jgi:stage III sporulation protein AH